MILFERNPKSTTLYVFFFLAAMAVNLSVSHAGFLEPGVRVLLGRYDTIFKVCNRTDETLHIAIIYKHNWKLGEPPTYPVKGWFVESPGECTNFAINNLVGFMSVVKVTKDGKLEPYYTSSTPLKDISLSNNEAMMYKPHYLCIGEAPFEGYKDKFVDYQKCKKDQKKVPFNVFFRYEGGKNFTLELPSK